MFCGFIAKPNLDTVDAIDTRIAGRGAAQNFNTGSREKSEVREIIAHMVGQIHAFYHACTAHPCVAQSCNVH